ncbi:hypothetical protein [uncultured Tateyamaria sp.]|uniref:hypothetical protein n=1 Tax=uncultured Tateyamaria sp. TaxID=455651 RepID=UPI0026326D4A|nr:hypothetical protein [uncultured Tateyamaria sp.]
MVTSALSDILEENPLLGFSIYTSTQVQALGRKAVELKEIAASWGPDESGSLVIHDFTDYYDNFWFWVLGAFEVIRTLDQHSDCFREKKMEELREIKRELKRVRIPFAKQELANNGRPIFAELSVIGFDKGMKFEISGSVVDSGDLVEATMGFLESFKPTDVLKRIPERSN